MKKFLFFILLALTSCKIFSQAQYDKFLQLKLKKGIYFSFQQITANNPLLTDSFIIKERANGNIVMWGGGKYTFELPLSSKSELRKIRKELTGISDGENFYMSDRFTINGRQGMTRCLLSGPYIIAPIQGSTSQYTPELTPSLTRAGKGFLINLNDSTTRPLSKKLIRKLLKKHPDITQEYTDKSDLIELSAEIIDKVNKAEKG